MKKLLVLALSALLVLGLASVSMAAATFSGEIRVGLTGSNTAGAGSTSDYSYGKMILNGKLGDDLTGTLVFLSDPVTAIVVDEADVTFTEDWGAVKLGYYGWNNNIKDIIGTVTNDIKSKSVVSFSFPITDALKLGAAYAYTGTSTFATDYVAQQNSVGLDLGYTGETVGFDALYYSYNSNNTAWGANAYLKVGEFKPFLQYRSMNWSASSKIVTDGIIGITYEPAATPIYLRAEINIAAEGIYKQTAATTNLVTDGKVTPTSAVYAFEKYASAPWGIRFGYKLEDGAKIELQYKTSGYQDKANTVNSEYYLKVMCPF